MERLAAARIAHRDALGEIERLVRSGIEAGVPPGDMRAVVEMARSAAAIRQAPVKAG